MLSYAFPISRTSFLAPRCFSFSIVPSRSKKMSIDMKFHAFAGSNIKSKIPKSKERTPASALEALKHSLLSTDSDDCGKILLFRNGRPLVGCPSEDDSDSSVWRLEWLNTVDCKELVGDSGDRPIVYLGVDGESAMLWGLDVSSDDVGGELLGKELGRRSLCFVELRTLMVATDWTDVTLLQQLAVAGQVMNLADDFHCCLKLTEMVVLCCRAGHCLNGVACLSFVDIVERKQFLLKLEGRSNVSMTRVKGGFTHALTLY